MSFAAPQSTDPSGPLPPPAAVLFDLDGVLLHSYWVWFHLLNDAAQSWGYPPIDKGAFDHGWGQSTEADRESFFPEQDVAEIEAFFKAHFMDHVEHMEVPDRVSDVFACLEALEIPSAVITNTQSNLATALVERAGASPNLVVGANDVARPKPAPDIVLHAAARLGVDPRSSWVVGDSKYDREAAEAAGAHFVGVGGIDGCRRVAAVSELIPVLKRVSEV